MGIFSGIKKAKMRNQSDWAGVGQYFVRIDRVKLDQNRKEETGFFIEATVLHCVEQGTNTNGELVAPHRPGDAITQTIWQKFPDTFLPNVKAFIASASDTSPAAVTEEDAEKVVNSEGEFAQPLSGMVMEYKGRMILTKAGREFTEISWRGEVSAARLRASLSKAVVDTYFDGGAILDQMEEQEKQLAALQAG